MAAYNPYNLSNSQTNLFGSGSLAASMGSNPGSVQSWGGVADWSQPLSGTANAASSLSNAANTVAGTPTTPANTTAAASTSADASPATPDPFYAGWNPGTYLPGASPYNPANIAAHQAGIPTTGITPENFGDWTRTSAGMNWLYNQPGGGGYFVPNPKKTAGDVYQFGAGPAYRVDVLGQLIQV
jgi:hypothetical protein